MEIKGIWRSIRDIFIRIYLKNFIKKRAELYNVNKEIVDLACDIVGDFRKDKFVDKTVDSILDFIHTHETEEIIFMFKEIYWERLLEDLEKLFNWFKTKKGL